LAVFLQKKATYLYAMAKIENIIFDLGGVLLDIDFSRTARAFEALGFTNIEQQFNFHNSIGLFNRMETGQLSNETFLDALAAEAPQPVSSLALSQAWNAILIGFRKSSILHLSELATRYRLFLLSNTNRLHYDTFSALFTRDTGLQKLEDCFTHAWFSHDLGMRKPDPAIYQKVIQLGRLEASATLFIDDSLANVEGARSVGLETHLLLPDQTIESLGL
jgi:glucose-1-phosphatase